MCVWCAGQPVWGPAPARQVHVAQEEAEGVGGHGVERRRAGGARAEASGGKQGVRAGGGDGGLPSMRFGWL
jgi:hypothetical protein